MLMQLMIVVVNLSDAFLRLVVRFALPTETFDGFTFYYRPQGVLNFKCKMIYTQQRKACFFVLLAITVLC